MSKQISYAFIILFILLSSCIKTTQKVTEINNKESKVLTRKDNKIRDDVNYMILEGLLIDLENNEELPFRNITLKRINSNDKPLYTTTNTYGKFNFLIEKEGDYILNINTLGYKELNIDNIKFKKGKNIIFKIGLYPLFNRLEEIDINLK